VAIHQYSATGQVPGVAGNVDLNACIWPLSTLLPEEVELDANQNAMLSDIHAALPIISALYQQLAGPDAVFPDFPGWPTWPGGTNEKLSLLDYLRRSNVQTYQALLDVQDVATKLAALPAGTPVAGAAVALSDADVQRIADALAASIAQRLNPAA
jgi:hypothetical protein